MIQLTDEQQQALESGDTHVRAANETYVLIPQEVYEQMKKLVSYDDEPWTDEEVDLLAEEAGEMLDRYQP